MQDEDNTLSLAGAIAAWAAAADAADGARTEALVELLNYCADAVVQVLADGDAEASEALAAQLVPLRLALGRWPAAGSLPPYGALLGCLQSLLRGEWDQLARLRTKLDEGLAAALAQIEGLAAAARAPQPDLPPALEGALAAGDPAGIERALAGLAGEERERALAGLRRRSEEQVGRMSPEQQRSLALYLRQEQIRRTADDVLGLAAQALREAEPHAVRRLAIEMGQAATHYAKDEPPGSPYDELASFLRGVAAVLRGTQPPPVPAAYTERLAALRALAEQGE